MMGFQVYTVDPPEAHPSRRSYGSAIGLEDAVEMVDISMAARTAEDPVWPSAC
jgi:hypothetical protein